MSLFLRLAYGRCSDVWKSLVRRGPEPTRLRDIEGVIIFTRYLYAFAAIMAVTISTAWGATDPIAQASPTPIVSPHGAAPEEPAAPPLPKNFDPCGGPLELLNKIGNASACVFVLGEAALTLQYGSANFPANTQLNVGSRRSAFLVLQALSGTPRRSSTSGSHQEPRL
jgi:hypothetical protein